MLKMKKGYKAGLYLILYTIFQIIFLGYAYYNNVLDAYLGLAFWQWVIGAAGIAFAVWKDGNVNIILDAALLLSVGQLIQAAIHTGETFDYEQYQNTYAIFLAAAAAASVILWIAYKRFYKILYHRFVPVTMGIVCIALVFFLKYFGVNQRGAHLWIHIAGNFNLQLTEIIKVLFIVSIAGMLCREEKLSVGIQIGALVLCGGLAVLMAILINEFGTALVIAFTGMMIIYIFQSVKGGRWILGVLVLAAVGTIGVFVWGNGIYQSLPGAVSDETFSEQFASAAVKSKLMEMLEEYEIEDTEKLQVFEAGMGKSYEDFVSSMKRNLRQEDIDKCNTPVPDGEEIPKVQGEYKKGIQLLASDASFRADYQDRFLNSEIYNLPMKAAYQEVYMTNGQGGIFRKIEQKFFAVYLQGAGKIQAKFRGFLKPEQEAQGNAYHVNQVLNAMLTGKAFGNGPSIQFYDKISASNTDMVFGMTVAEYGGIMGIFIIVLNLLFFKEAIQISLGTPSMCQQGVAVGLGISWLIQVMIIVGGNCRWMPFTGITLPLISEGGTSLVICILMVVLLELISVEPLPTPGKRRFYQKERTHGLAKLFPGKGKKQDEESVSARYPGDEEEEFEEKIVNPESFHCETRGKTQIREKASGTDSTRKSQRRISQRRKTEDFPEEKKFSGASIAYEEDSEEAFFENL